MAYKRVLLKLSGEQLAGKFEGGLDPETARYFANEIKALTEAGVQVVVMVGGGNYLRGDQFAGQGIKRVTADQMGMLATIMNALALTDIFEDNGIKTRCLTNIFAQQVAEPFVIRLAEKHLQKGRVVVAAGGTGRPYVTTDTAAVAHALELDCEVVLKATKVAGVYDKDPEKHDDAVLFDTITLQHAVENPGVKVMDKAALGLASDHGLPIIVFDVAVPGNIAKAVAGESVGTKIS